MKDAGFGAEQIVLGLQSAFDMTPLSVAPDVQQTGRDYSGNLTQLIRRGTK